MACVKDLELYISFHFFVWLERNNNNGVGVGRKEKEKWNGNNKWWITMIHRACYQHQPVRSAFGVHSFSHHENEKNKRASERAFAAVTPPPPPSRHRINQSYIGAGLSLSLYSPFAYTLSIFFKTQNTQTHAPYSTLLSSTFELWRSCCSFSWKYDWEREKKRRMKERTYCCWLVYRAVTVCRLLPALVAWVELNGRPRATS